MNIKEGVLRVALAALVSGLLGCGDEADVGSGSAGSGHNGGSGGASGSSAQGGAGSGGGGTGGGGSTAGGVGPRANGHCGTGNISLVTGLERCEGYDPVANGMPVGLDYHSVSALELQTPLAAGQALAISCNLTMGMPVADFWGADTSCGPALQRLATLEQAGIGCADTLPAAAYPFLLLVHRNDSGTISDIRACADVKCP